MVARYARRTFRKLCASSMMANIHCLPNTVLTAPTDVKFESLLKMFAGEELTTKSKVVSASEAMA